MVERYNLKVAVRERHDAATRHPEVVQRIELLDEQEANPTAAACPSSGLGREKAK